jgi:hypothetical protein
MSNEGAVTETIIPCGFGLFGGRSFWIDRPDAKLHLAVLIAERNKAEETLCGRARTNTVICLRMLLFNASESV